MMKNNTRHWYFLMFCIIGVINTIVDVTIFLGLREVAVPIILANIVSTSTAVVVSYFLNRRFTFRSNREVARSLPQFIIITLIGLWVLQPIIIGLGLLFLNSPAVDANLTAFVSTAGQYYELLAKLAATPTTLVWNFVLYRSIVFKRTDSSK